MRRYYEKIVVFRVVYVLCGAFSYAGITDEEIKRQKLEKINQLNEMYEPACEFKAATAFPSTHPADAFSGTASWATKGSSPDEFNLYVWTESGETWIEIEPVIGVPSIYSSSFVIIQNSIQYDTVKVEVFSGSSQGGRIYVPSVFKLTQWSFYTTQADLSQAFTLIYDGVWDVYSFDIPGLGSTPTPTPIPTSDLSDTDNDGVIDIWDNCPNTPPNSYVDPAGCPGTNYCLAIGSDMSFTIPCVMVGFVKYEFNLDYYINPADPLGLYWKLDINSLTVK